MTNDFTIALDAYDGHGKQVKVYRCCGEMSKFMEEMERASLPVGTGEISGNISIYPTYISFDDGWNFYPTLRLRYCPFCGAERLKPGDACSTPTEPSTTNSTTG
jgi:hypothetical protein